MFGRLTSSHNGLKPLRIRSAKKETSLAARASASCERAADVLHLQIRSARSDHDAKPIEWLGLARPSCRVESHLRSGDGEARGSIRQLQRFRRAKVRPGVPVADF